MRVACIPAFDEERTIAKVIIGAQKYVDKVIVCDDGSTDMTALISERLGSQVIRHPRNMGKGEALRSLFVAARDSGADVMVTLDGDGQHDPDDIPALLEALSRADIVVGSRFLSAENEVPRHRAAVNKMLNVVTVDGVSDTQSGMRAYEKRAVQSLMPSEMGMGVDSEILIQAKKAGLRVVEVPISVKYGIGKTSTHNPAFHTLDVLASVVKLTSLRHPLIFYGFPGLVVTLVGIYYAVVTFLDVQQIQVITPIALAHALLSLALLSIGLLTLFTGVILFTMTTVVRQSTRS